MTYLPDAPPPPPLAEPDRSFSSSRLAMMRGTPEAAGTLFVTTMVYSLGRELGHVQAIAHVAEQLQRAAEGDLEGALPVVKAITRLRQIFDVKLSIASGATSIGKARSRHFHEALESGADVWVSIDDDVEADAQTLAALVEAVQGQTAICIAPCWLREQDRVNVMLDPAGGARELASGARTLAALAGGFGMVALSRSALVRFAERFKKSLAFKDNDGREKIAVFQEPVHDGLWYSEDVAFFLRTPPGVRVEALASGTTTHAGRALSLDTFTENKMMSRLGEPDETPTDAPALPAETVSVVDGPELAPEHAALLAADRDAASKLLVVDEPKQPGQDQQPTGPAE